MNINCSVFPRPFLHRGIGPRHASHSVAMLSAMHTYMYYKQKIFSQLFQILTVISKCKVVVISFNLHKNVCTRRERR